MPQIFLTGRSKGRSNTANAISNTAMGQDVCKFMVHVPHSKRTTACSAVCLTSVNSNHTPQDDWMKAGRKGSERKRPLTNLMYCRDLWFTIGRGLEWWLELLTTYTPLGTASNYSATVSLHNSQITAPTKPLPACYVLTSRSLATASNSENSSASRAQILPSLTVVQNFLPAVPSTELDLHPFSASLAELNCTQHWTESESELLYDCRFTVNQFILAPSPLRLMTSNFSSWSLA
jgi:hypothetical protein